MRSFIAALALSLCSITLFGVGSGAPVFINEIHYDNTGEDVDEMIEIAGPAGTDLSGYSLILYNGASTSRAPYNTRTLTGVIPDQMNGFGTAAFFYPVNGIQNGSPDGMALVGPGGLIQFLSYEGTFTAVGGPADGMTSVSIGVSEDGTEPIGQSLQLTGSGTHYGDFTWSGPVTATPSAVNIGQTFGETPTLTLSIDDFSADEGNTGITLFTFTVSLNMPAPAGGISFDIATADDSATSPGDYTSINLVNESIPAGSVSKSYDVNVIGDTVVEPNETFKVIVSNVSAPAVVVKGEGIGTIVNDDPAIISIAALNTSYDENFDTLASSGTSSATPGGWYLRETGSGGAADGQYVAGTGSGNGGNVYSFGAAGSAERAFGTLRSGAVVPTIGANYSNDTGTTIRSLIISYTGEQWRLGTAGRADRLDFQYSLDAADLGSGTWTDADALDFSSVTTTGTAGARDGNAPANRASVNGFVTGLSIPPGSTFWIRFSDFDAAGADDGLAIDDFSLVASDTVPPTGSATATPSAVEAGETSRLSVTVVPGVNPASTNITVTADLTPIGGAAAQPLFDDGTNGDATANDNTFTYDATVSLSTPLGAKTIAFVIADAQGRSTSASTGLTVDPPLVVYEIFDIQGSGPASPFAGTKVKTVENVVTSVAPQGFFIQTPDWRADASTATSNGIFVFTSTAPSVQVGNEVEVSGLVIEFFGMTEFTPPVSYKVTAPSVALPAYFEVPQGFTDFESVEGMLARVTNGRAAVGTDQFGETKIVAGPERPFRTPGLFAGRPDIFEVDPTKGTRTPNPGIVGGATIHSATGPIMFTFSDYVVWTDELTFENPPFPRAVRARTSGEFTVGAQNMFRLFDDVDDPAIGEPVTPTADYQARLAAFSHHIRQILGSPEVLAMSEVENLATLQDLAARLNGDDATLGYTAYLIEGNDIGGIDVGFLVRGSVQVDSVSQIGATDTWIAPGGSQPELLNDRPPLMLRGAYTGNGTPFPIAVIGVHQRSLIGVETSDRVRRKRQEQAFRLSQAIQGLQTAEPHLKLVVTGDFNAFEFSDGYADVMGQVTGILDPAGALVPGSDEVDPDLTNHVLNVAASDRYSYVHEGVTQVLDHSLTTASLASWHRGMQFARANADAPFSANRVSDHDGLVLFVMSDRDGDGHPDDQDSCAAGDNRPTVVLGGCDSRAPNVNDDGCSLIDRLAAIKAAARNRGEMVSAASALLNGLMKSGKLTGAEKGAIESCVARWN
ncbi:MAG TPA: choice-of-anchor X domain-containing protein [Thermoanaerobaculia bacterium]|nr:choice-of-anchor X domain-containing protein [Thermoanaerobaculia bacterium]